MTSPIIGFIGRRGDGKTLLMTAFIVMMSKINQDAGVETTIYSNYDIYLDDMPLVTVIKLNKKIFDDLFGQKMKAFELKNAIFAFDEIAAYTDAYSWMKEETKRLAMFALQSRKRKVNIFYTAQFTSLVPVRIRKSTEKIIMPTFLKNQDMIIYDIYDFEGGCGLLYESYMTIDGISRFFERYDTDQTIEIL